MPSWRTGWSPNKSRKWSWNRPRNIGDPYGRRWSGCWQPHAGCTKARARGRERCIWRRRSRIEGRHGRKKDFPDAERLVKRLVAQELKLSFVPDVEQRLWRTIMRRKHQLTRNRVQFQNRLECLLEEAHIKLSSLVSDLLGKSARRMLQAVAEGATSPEAIAALADQRLRATARATVRCARSDARDLHPVYRQLLKMALEELKCNRRTNRQARPGDGEPTECRIKTVVQRLAASANGLGARGERRKGERPIDRARGTLTCCGFLHS